MSLRQRDPEIPLFGLRTSVPERALQEVEKEKHRKEMTNYKTKQDEEVMSQKPREERHANAASLSDGQQQHRGKKEMGRAAERGTSRAARLPPAIPEFSEHLRREGTQRTAEFK
ncbi:hypothetical protein TREES_T100007249 [Tupaia chinensis]|uniref:Uncharacterized protein n=1 Tax=Tupaia chinensis TaxID=246437 RepID=L9L5M6_TUPCH|nr:hypothetical protein TREES_T100007249 [Tupaia chinensis]